MTRLLSIDPGRNTGIALGYYDAITPYRLLERWQVHSGLVGFRDWWDANAENGFAFDEIVCEKFELAKNEFKADTTPLLIEGALMALWDGPLRWQPRTDKARLTGYPKSAVTKAQRQRVRFDFLKRFGMFKSGSDNDDSNDAITHALIALKARRHMPTMLAFWPERPRNVVPITVDAPGF